mgnify:CR=1 FL=1
MRRSLTGPYFVHRAKSLYLLNEFIEGTFVLTILIERTRVNNLVNDVSRSMINSINLKAWWNKSEKVSFYLAIIHKSFVLSIVKTHKKKNDINPHDQS